MVEVIFHFSRRQTRASGHSPLRCQLVVHVEEARGRLVEGFIELVEVVGDVADETVRQSIVALRERAQHPAQIVVEQPAVQAQLAGSLDDPLREPRQDVAQR